MHFPVHLPFFGKNISVHLLAEVLGIFIGVRYYLYLRKRLPDRISDLNRLKIFVAVCLGALLGSRLVGVLENPSAFMATGDKFRYVFSNKTIVGGLLFGLFFVEILKAKLGIAASSGDMMTYPLLLALIIGRVGCFCEGLDDGTIGRQTDLFTGVDFGDGLLRHPLPLYEIAFLALLWCFIFMLDKKQVLADGAKFKFFLIPYFAYRFLVEFMKENDFTWLGLSTIQLACGAGIIYYYKTIIHPKRLFLAYA